MRRTPASDRVSRPTRLLQICPPHSTPDQRTEQHERPEGVVPAVHDLAAGQHRTEDAAEDQEPGVDPDEQRCPSRASPGRAPARPTAGRRRSPDPAGRRTTARRTARRRPASPARRAPAARVSRVTAQPDEHQREHARRTAGAMRRSGSSCASPVDQAERDVRPARSGTHITSAQCQPSAGTDDGPRQRPRTAPAPGQARAGPRCRRTVSSGSSGSAPGAGSGLRAASRLLAAPARRARGMAAMRRGTNPPPPRPPRRRRSWRSRSSPCRDPSDRGAPGGGVRRVPPRPRRASSSTGTSNRPVIARTWSTACHSSSSSPPTSVRPEAVGRRGQRRRPRVVDHVEDDRHVAHGGRAPARSGPRRGPSRRRCPRRPAARSAQRTHRRSRAAGHAAPAPRPCRVGAGRRRARPRRLLEPALGQRQQHRRRRRPAAEHDGAAQRVRRSPARSRPRPRARRC